MSQEQIMTCKFNNCARKSMSMKYMKVHKNGKMKCVSKDTQGSADSLIEM